MPDEDRGLSQTERASLRAALRSATSDLHSHLDRGLGDLASSPARYVAFLKGSRRAVAGLERALARLGVPASVPRIDRGDAIDADLAALGAAPPPPLASWIPQSIAEGYGAAYVLEGSALGGVVLAKRVHEALPGAQGATRYLELHGERTGERWRSFVLELERWGGGASDGDRGKACAAAIRAFGVFVDAFAAEGSAEVSCQAT